ncbi:NTP transferase domain-containing protein [Massilia sp. TS11]|uniref:nucleotidyltransferase family protein n=1 Tax=Massilia sp. TS11 TaxID=2908003 RepID=UPI001EDAD4E9|nr:nucleotidyltransferase family protein [Massilia sp. TS11]MCG2586744.1 nucleotidyltransferase family protein [Massilia sp. TS11]
MTAPPVGILLAAGRGRRFDPSGARNKLLQPLPGGECVAAASARTLLTVLPRVLAVVRSDDDLAARLRALGCEIVLCPQADNGMAASLVQGIRASADAASWLIALADMPLVRPDTVRALSAALAAGASIAVPEYAGRRGNPVGFQHHHLTALLALAGDRGARALVASADTRAVAVDDPGIHADIDTPTSLTLAATASPTPTHEDPRHPLHD